MRVIYDIDAYPRMHNSYSFQHLYKILNSGFCAGVSTFNNNPSDFLYREEYDGLDYYVIIDNVGKTEAFGRDTLKKMSSQGTKIIAVTYDPSSFKGVHPLVTDKSLAGVVVFDKSSANNFNCKTFVSDYVFNDEFFPAENETPSGEVCIYGTVGNIPQRANRYGLTKIDDTDTDYYALYRSIQKYNGVHVFTTSLGEDCITVVHNNKAKPVETLLCGRNPYCEMPMSTIRYDRYLKTDDQIPTPQPISFSRNEILLLNVDAITCLVEFLKHV